MLDWAGITIIVTVQLATFFYTMRRIDALAADVGELRERLAEVRERVSRLEGVMLGRGDASAD